MSSTFYEASIIAVVGIAITFSVIRFTMAFYSNPPKAVQLIRLGKNSVSVFIMFLSLNFIFTFGYLFQIFPVGRNSNLIAILVYAFGTSFFFFSLSKTISRKYVIK